jgi:DNA-binding winged helix-turn-helix (wHTH) protein/TolB-like protein/Flp pilus assembly protein TadD
MPDRKQLFRFGSFELDCASRELRKNGLRLKLEEQPFRLLAELISRHGDVVTREELRNTLWSDDTYVDFERGLTRVINKVRLTLADEAINPRFIETVPRRGYRFVAPVSTLDRSQELQDSSSLATNGPESVVSSVLSSEENASNPVGRNIIWRIAWALIAVALTGLIWFRHERPSVPPITAIAVLPVHHVDGDIAEGTLAESITDELIISISRIHSLRVVSLRSVMPYTESKKSLAEVARELKVDGLVDSSLHLTGTRTRLTVRLIRFPAERAVWSRTYEPDAASGIALQNEIAQNIAREIGVVVSSDDRKRLVQQTLALDPAVQALYTKGRFLATEPGRDAIERGIRILQKVIETEPTYAPAYAALAEGWFGLSSVYLPPLETMPKARAFARKAIELDPDSDDARAVLGRVHVFYDWDWAAAEEQFRQALESNPSSANAYKGRACLRMAQGRTEEALKDIDLALRIDPRSLWLHFMAVAFRANARRYDDAVEQARRSLDWEPRFGLLRSFVGVIYAMKGNSGDAAREMEAGVQQQRLPTSIGFLALGSAVAGRSIEAERALSDLLSIAEHQYVCPFEVASAYASLRKKDEAFAWLAKGIADRADCIIWLRAEPWLDPIRDDPRYAALVRQIWLP